MIINGTLKRKSPKKCQTGNTFPFKKRISKECHNYKGIILNRTVEKMYEELIEKRPSENKEQTLEDTQDTKRLCMNTTKVIQYICYNFETRI